MQIEPLNPLFEDLRLIVSERNQAFAELRSISKKAREADKNARGEGFGDEGDIEGTTRRAQQRVGRS